MIIDKPILIDFQLTTFFLYRFLSSGIRNQYQSSIDIDCYWLLSIIGSSIDYAWQTIFVNKYELVGSFPIKYTTVLFYKVLLVTKTDWHRILSHLTKIKVEAL